jgi:hypothetical protein
MSGAWSRLAASAAVVLTIHLGPSAARADTVGVTDCAPPPPIEKAVFSDLVFVGRVTDLADGDRLATVEVTEVWRGDVPSPVMVAGGQDPTNPAEDDRAFELGVTYLFVPVQFDPSGSGLVIDSVCSSTVPWSDDLARLRPPEVGQPGSTSPASTAGPGPLAFLGDLAMPLLTAAIIGGSVLGFAFVISARREV